MPKVILRNEITNESKKIKIGWSWTLFFFSGFMGLLPFARGLNVWGAVIFALWVAHSLLSAVLNIGSGFYAHVYLGTLFSLSIALIGIVIGLALKGNAMTGKMLLENGWVFDDPDEKLVLLAKTKWNLLKTSDVNRSQTND